MDDVTECPACGGDAQPLGALGNRMHYRCRQCGMNCSAIVEADAGQDTETV